MKNILLHLLLFLSCGVFAAELKINNRVIDKGYSENANSWKFEKSVDLVSELPPAEFLISEKHIRKHPTSKHIRGYNGNITLMVKAPGKIKYLDINGTIANFPDTVVREAAFSYSFNGVDFVTAEKKSFGGKHGHKAVVGTKIDLPDNKGIIFLKFERFCKKGDRNGLYGNVLWQNFNIKLGGTFFSPDEKKASKDYSLQKAFPTGVFWAWERTEPNAKYAKMELWDFVEKNMQVMKENNYDTCWIIHSNAAQQPKILELAQKYGLRVLFNTDMQNFFYQGGSLDDMEQQADSTVARIGHYDSLMGYILKDEPGLWDLAATNHMYKVMKKADPMRDSISVVMNAQSIGYIRDSKLPVVCSDVYYFGSDNSTQLPHPQSVSMSEFTNAIGIYNTLAARYSKNHWFMGQMFGDVWGRNYFNGQKVVVYPGSYLHWRMPTEAESRWQIWESLRLGSKGLFFYVFHPGIPLEVPPEKASTKFEKYLVSRMDRYAKMAASWGNQKLTDKKIELDQQGGMLLLGGKPSKQMLATSAVNKIIRSNEKLLVERRKADFPVFFSDDSRTVAETFVSNDRYIGVVVNNDLDKKRIVNVLLPLNVKKVRDIGSGKELKISPANDNFQKIAIILEAGGGALLEAEFFKQPGMDICNESFDSQKVNRVIIGKNAEIIFHGNMAADENRSLRLKKDGDPNIPVCTLRGFSNAKRAHNTFTKNIGLKKGKYYMLVKGVLRSCTVKAATAAQKEVKTNTMHLKNTPKQSAAGNDGIIIADKDFFRPVVIPNNTTSLEFYLKNGYISDIQIWYVPEVQK